MYVFSCSLLFFISASKLLLLMDEPSDVFKGVLEEKVLPLCGFALYSVSSSLIFIPLHLMLLSLDSVCDESTVCWLGCSCCWWGIESEELRREWLCESER